MPTIAGRGCSPGGRCRGFLVARPDGEADIPDAGLVAGREHVGQILVDERGVGADHDALVDVTALGLAQQGHEPVEVVGGFPHGHRPALDDREHQVIRGRRQRGGFDDLGDIHDELVLVPVVQPGGGHEEDQQAEDHIDHRRHVDDRQLVGLDPAGKHRTFLGGRSRGVVDFQRTRDSWRMRLGAVPAGHAGDPGASAVAPRRRPAR